MKEIDFLPSRYRENDARRRAGLWRFVLVLLLGGAVTAASLGQFAYKAKVKAQLLDIQPLLAQAHAMEANSAQLKTELSKASQTAKLYAIVQTPWPKTQVIAAIVAPLNESIIVREIHHSRQGMQNSSRRDPMFEFQLGPSDDTNQTTSDTETDLAAIKAQLYQSRDVIKIVGETNNQAVLHNFLEKLDESPLFETVELIEVDTITSQDSQPRLQFTASIVVLRPIGTEKSPATANMDSDKTGRLAG